MNTILKKAMSVLIISSMLLSTNVSAVALETNEDCANVIPIAISDAEYNQLLSLSDFDNMMLYAKDIVPSYINDTCDENDNIKISSPIKVYNTHFYYIFVICNNNIIGKLQITKYDNEFISSFDYAISDAIKNAYANGENVKFVNYNGNIYMCSGNGITDCIDKSATVQPEENVVFEAPFNKIEDKMDVPINSTKTAKSIIQLDMDEMFSYNLSCGNDEDGTILLPETKNNSINDTAGSNSEYKAIELSLQEKEELFSKISEALAETRNATKLNVSYVANEIYNDRWVCWAACTAIALNCKQNSSLNATSVAQAVENSGLTSNGSVDCVKRSYSLYGYTVNNNVETAISGSEMLYYISMNMPVQINIISDYNVAHAVTVYGVELSSNTVTYYFIDPSRASDSAFKKIKYTNLSPSTVTTLFNYTGLADDGSSSIVYTRWYRTYR